MWRCGSTIYEMEAYYKKKGRAKAAFPKFPTSGLAFPTFPTNGTIALGSWMACENHGNSGDGTGPSHTPFSKVILIERATREEKVFDTAPGQPHPVPAARQFMQEHKHRWVLMAKLDESKLFPIDDASNWLLYRMLVIRTKDDVAEWLLGQLCAGSLSAGASMALACAWNPSASDPFRRIDLSLCFADRPHREPHFAPPRAATFKPTPFVCGWHEPPEN